MPLMNRFGSFAASASIRVNATALYGSASAFFETNSRPALVAAHSVDVSFARATREMLPPARSPQPAAVSRVEELGDGGQFHGVGGTSGRGYGAAPSGSQSPQ
jgi:hypothetical protein